MFRREMISVKSEYFRFQSQRFFDRISSARIRCLVLLLVLFAWQIQGMGQTATSAYQDPDFEAVVFNQDALSLQGNNRVTVVEALAALASNFPGNGLVDMDLQEKALAIALRLDPLSASARTARQALLSGKIPAKTGYFQELSSINKMLWKQAMVMKKGQDPGDAAIIPLLMELALVIYPGAPPEAAAIYAETVDAMGDKLPDWNTFVKVGGGKNSSSARAQNVLQRGHKAQVKMAELATARIQQAAVAVTQQAKKASPPPPVMVEAAKDSEAKSTGQILIPFTEVHVVAWQRVPRGPAVQIPGKMMLDIRNPKQEDAVLFDNGSDADPAKMGLRFRKKNINESMPWVSFVMRVIKPRHPDWPRGKVAEVGFVFLGEGQDGGEVVEKGLGTGLSLALESALTGVPIDPGAIVYGRIEPDGRFIKPVGDLAQAMGSARKGGYRVIAVAPEVEQQMQDWVALGDLDRLIRPQIVASSNMDELMGVIRSDRSAEVEEALQLFSEIEDLTSKMTLQEAAKNAVVQQRLQAIEAQLPQHLSAKMLLAYGKGGDQMKASLGGSVAAIHDALAPLRKRYDTAMDGRGEVVGEEDELGDTVMDHLKELRNKVDDESKELLNMSEDVVEEAVRFLRLKNKTTSSGMQKREAVEEALVYFNEEFRRLKDKIANQTGRASEQ